MTRGQGGRRHRSLGAVPVLGAFWWSRRLLLLGLAIGLVVMHHLVGAHEHGPDQPSATAASTPASPIPASGGHDQHLAQPLDAAIRPAGHAVTATAELHLHPDPGGHGEHGTATLLHVCLAVLAAALAMTALLLLVWWSRTVAGGHRPTARPVLAVSPRGPPPMSLRLAQLQVLRL